ncbi:MAG TPA: heme-binding protein [Steroidobacteraceae bacterium]|nr:heme-binding protein [Steroidobacteraceae bacterium]
MKLKTAETIVDTALAEGLKRNLRPLTVAVLDAGGHVVVIKRADGASLMRTQIATGKAWAVLGMGFGGRELARRAAGMPLFYNALIELSGGNMVCVPGGALIRDAAGEVVGAVGITGDTSDNDEVCAVAGIQAAGLVPDTGDAQK